MPGSVKTMAVSTVAALVIVAAYTAALGGNGWLWFGWLVLGAVTAGVFATYNT